MSTNLFRKIFEGINFQSKTVSSTSGSGDLENVNNKLYFNNGTTNEPVLTEHVVDTSLTGPFVDDSTIPSSKAVKTALDAEATSLSNHITDATDAHNSTAITNTPVNGIVATTTQAAINELQTNSLAHINSLTAHTAANIVNVPAGNLAATTVQGALDEIQTELDGKAQADKLIDTVTKIVDFTDNTKVIKFDVDGVTATSTTIASSQTVDRVLNLPDSDGNIATEQFANDAAVKYSIILG